VPEFEYQVRDAAGVSRTGRLQADSQEDAARRLRQGGDTILTVEPADGSSSSMFEARRKRIRSDDVIFFANQLAVMVDTGVPLSDALDSIYEQSDHSGMRSVLRDLSDQVKGGVEFSVALERHPKVFGRLFVSMMRASEMSGTMGQMLLRVSAYMKDERDVRKQIKGAMVYPLCMLCFCAIVVTGLLIFVLPRFEKIYAGKGAILPAPTRVLLGASRGLINYWPIVLVLLVGAVVGAVMYFRSPAGRRLLDGVKINVPVVGGMYRKAYLARSMRTMATMVGSGVSILDGLQITAEVTGNHHYGTVWTDLAERVKEGSTLADHLRTSVLIPNTVSQMVSAGERTGKLGNVMNRVADFCEDDVKTSVKAVTSLIEPAMIIAMGLIIGGIAMALLLPVFNVSKLIAH